MPPAVVVTGSASDAAATANRAADSTAPPSRSEGLREAESPADGTTTYHHPDVCDGDLGVSAAAQRAASSALIDASRINIAATSEMITPDKNADVPCGRSHLIDAEANRPGTLADEASTERLQKPDGSSRVNVPRINNEAAPVPAQPDKAVELQTRPDVSTDSDLRADRAKVPSISNEAAPAQAQPDKAVELRAKPDDSTHSDLRADLQFDPTIIYEKLRGCHVSNSCPALGLTAIDVCAGAGGMAIAVRHLGFEHEALIDSDDQCVATLRRNGFAHAVLASVEEVDFTKYVGTTLVTAGFPCQPWSVGGKRRGQSDSRDLWNHAVRAIREVNPEMFVFEMVQGFMAQKFAKPRRRLLRDLSRLGYLVQLEDVNAKDYGVPQARRRCLIIGQRRGGMTPRPDALPRVTAGEALQDLGPPGSSPEHVLARHCAQGEARSYKGHQPSQLSAPAKTIRAGVHGPGGGNNTVVLEDGSVRYFTLREMARLQSFPDGHLFNPTWSRAVKEIGNACPPALVLPWLRSMTKNLLAAREHDKGVPSWSPTTTTIMDRESDSEPDSDEEDESDDDDADTTLGVMGGVEPYSGDCASRHRSEESKAHEKLLLELNQRRGRIHALQAQAHVLHGLYCADVRPIAEKGQVAMGKFIDALTAQADRIEGQLGPDRRDAMIASVQAYSDTLPEVRADGRVSKAAISRAVNRALELSACASAVHQEEILATSLAMEGMGKAHADDDCGQESQDDYFNLLDADVPDLPELPAECHGKRAVLLELPRRLLEAPTASDEDKDDSAIDFFHRERMLEVEADDERTKYHSMKASLPFIVPDSADVHVNSVVDSGAARCALRFEYMKRKLPHLVEQMQPSGLRFRDASKNRMSLRGKVPISLRVGAITVQATAYVFDDLGADFLLGNNAMKANGMRIDFSSDRLYARGDDTGVAAESVHCPKCEQIACVTESDDHWSHAGCCGQPTDDLQMICDRDACTIALKTAGGESTEVKCDPRRRVRDVTMVMDRETVIPYGEVVTLDPLLLGAPKEDALAPTIELFSDLTLEKAGLELDYSTLQNPNNERGVLRVRNCRTDKGPVRLPEGRVVASGGRVCDREPTVRVAAVLDEQTTPGLRGIDDGGIEDLAKLGFSLDKAVDPEMRREDGSYAPLSDEKKRRLYEIALRWYYVWSTDAKVPKTSYLVVIDIPTGDAAPQASAPYGIPEKLRSAALLEVNKLLKAGLIEPSMSDWCSPALVRVKKDSTKEDLKIKFAIDYRRVNAVTRLDAGGLGTQADILYSIGGKFKFLGLCDAAGGFYQFLLSPKNRHKSAFILPASMGGTLFQWRVAPYGLTRNPAGYSRGMQWVLKGLHDRRDLDGDGGVGTSMGGATSWLDDICMRATSFAGFCDLFNTVLERLATAGMTLKGAKCELLHEAMDLLGFVATPHGLMIQKPKIATIMKDGIPSNPKEAETFLGAVAFLRRMVPRISLLTAPMTDAIKRYKARKGTRKLTASRRAKSEMEKFNEEEQQDCDQAWTAVVTHLDDDAVVSSPDFEDPLAEFALCTDASDFAVGGVLMQWQHDQVRGPGPPADHAQEPPPGAPKPKYSDPLNNGWREKAGWKLKIIGYYSKTLDSAQRNYPAFDKEAGAILLCVRHWADLVTYHPTSVYTDSSVATSMLTKHAAPPRLQRWGVELGSYLPHLKISYRKGADNGLADLLSRFPAFKKFTSVREDIVELPDDLFDKIGEAPLFVRPASTRDSSHLSKAVYSLYEPKVASRVPETFWCAHSAPEIPGRGMKDRFKPGDVHKESDDIELDDLAVVAVSESRNYDLIASLLETLGDQIHRCQDRAEADSERWAQYVRIHSATYGRPPVVDVDAGASEEVAKCIELEAAALGCYTQRMGQADPLPADVSICYGPSRPTYDPFSSGKIVHLCPSRRMSAAFATVNGSEVAADADFGIRLPEEEPCVGAFAPELRLRSAIAQAVAHQLHETIGVPLNSGGQSVPQEALEHWADYGYGSRFPTDSPAKRSPPVPSFDDDCTNLLEQIALEETEPSPKAEVPEPCAPPGSVTVPITLADQLKDPELKLIISSLRGDRRVPKATRERTADKFRLDDDGLMRRINRDGEPGFAMLVPKAFRQAILARYHYSLVDGAGHSGGDRMYQQIRSSYYWSDMEDECHTFAQACAICGGTRSQPTFDIPTRSAPTPSRPFEVIHVDHKSGLPLSGGYAHVLVVVCALTRFTLYIPVRNATATATLDALMTHVFSVFGNPLVIISDNGSSFHNKLMKASEDLFGYRWVYVMPHTPQANGLAEAAVKKLKLILDRHTNEYSEWHRILPMAQASVNQRITTGTQTTPFVALFGRPPITLAALELPSLLPTSTPEQRDIQELGVTMARLHERLQRASDDVKEAARAAEKRTVKSPRRQILPGDKLWLVYSDSERSRYIRKHGHGKPWRHAFVVKQVKPHAVMLEVPRDGSVPDVLPWQSLRKCSFAAPSFHDDSMLLPKVDARGLATVDDDPDVIDPDLVEQKASEDLVTWAAPPTYEIDRVLSAKKAGGGWTLMVKWKGYPDPTPEPLSGVLRDTQHPEVLSDIARCQHEYLAQHPAERADFREDVPRPAPARVQPERTRSRPDNFTFSITGGCESAYHSELFSGGIRALTRACKLKSRSLRLFAPDLRGLRS